MLLKRVVTGAAVTALAGISLVEARYRRHPGNAIDVSDDGWRAQRETSQKLCLSGRVVIRNQLHRREVMLADVCARVRLLSTGATDLLAVEADVISEEKAYPPRPDGYWTAYVVKPGRYGQDTSVEVLVSVTGEQEALDLLYGSWISVVILIYGFEGYREQVHHVFLPLGPQPQADVGDWREAAAGTARVRPIRTHLLCPGDDPVDLVRRYVVSDAAPGDIVTIGETPLAVMQGRFRDPREQRSTWAATRLAQFMSGEGALGTAGGMQYLVDEVGAIRVAGALAGGALAKAVKQNGWFYRLAGPQARLVDDVSGTLPPYDKFVVGGPLGSDDVCRAIKAATGLDAAVVDANDLGKVDVIGKTPGVDVRTVRAALRSNPAGNGDEMTPLVLIRPNANH